MFYSCLLIHFAVVIGEANSEDNLDYIMPANYNTSRPDSDPIQISWMLTQHVVSELSAKRMEFTADLEYTCFWKDTELNITTSSYVAVPISTARKIWYPWLTYENCKGCGSSIIDPKHDSFFLENRLVVVISRKIVQFNCLLDLSYYPFDKQTCIIKIRLMYWDTPMNITHEEEDKYYKKLNEHQVLVPPEFILRSVDRIYQYCRNEKQNMSDTCISYAFVLQRIALPHILLVFLPSVLIVMLSWISFWLHVDLAAPRVALGLTSLLTLSTQFNSAQQNLPAVATIKALDIWMFGCIFMVFSSLLVYPVSYILEKKKKVEDRNPQSTTIEVMRRNQNYKIAKHSKKVARNLSQRIKDKRAKSMCYGIDKIARIIFPVVFTAFNIFYWNTYLIHQ